MNYHNGDTYQVNHFNQGSWFNDFKEGYGVFKTKNNEIYKVFR